MEIPNMEDGTPLRFAIDIWYRRKGLDKYTVRGRAVAHTGRISYQAERIAFVGSTFMHYVTTDLQRLGMLLDYIDGRDDLHKPRMVIPFDEIPEELRSEDPASKLGGYKLLYGLSKEATLKALHYRDIRGPRGFFNRTARLMENAIDDSEIVECRFLPEKLDWIDDKHADGVERRLYEIYQELDLPKSAV